MLAALLAKQIAVEYIVGVEEEHGFAPISPLYHMVRESVAVIVIWIEIGI